MARRARSARRSKTFSGRAKLSGEVFGSLGNCYKFFPAPVERKKWQYPEGAFAKKSENLEREKFREKVLRRGGIRDKGRRICTGKETMDGRRRKNFRRTFGRKGKKLEDWGERYLGGTHFELLFGFLIFFYLPPTLLSGKWLGGWPASPPQSLPRRIRESRWGTSWGPLHGFTQWGPLNSPV